MRREGAALEAVEEGEFGRLGAGGGSQAESEERGAEEELTHGGSEDLDGPGARGDTQLYPLDAAKTEDVSPGGGDWCLGTLKAACSGPSGPFGAVIGCAGARVRG